MNDIGTHAVERAAQRDPTDLDLTACVRAATAAPSLHNSQPWRFRVAARTVDVYADPRRQLEVLDPVDEPAGGPSRRCADDGGRAVGRAGDPADP